jgi:hypothetical protein
LRIISAGLLTWDARIVRRIFWTTSDVVTPGTECPANNAKLMYQAMHDVITLHGRQLQQRVTARIFRA